MKKFKGIIATLALCALVTSTSALAANTDFSFSLTSTTSKEATTGSPATKSTDGDQYAYVTPQASLSNLAIAGASVNVRVRDNAGNYATELIPSITSYQKYTTKYLSGKAVGGASYRLYANVESTSTYPVKLGGVWCP